MTIICHCFCHVFFTICAAAPPFPFSHTKFVLAKLWVSLWLPFPLGVIQSDSNWITPNWDGNYRRGIKIREYSQNKMLAISQKWCKIQNTKHQQRSHLSNTIDKKDPEWPVMVLKSENSAMAKLLYVSSVETSSAGHAICAKAYSTAAGPWRPISWFA